MNTFTISEKTLSGLPGGNLSLTRDETEKIAQVFGLRVLDWRRLSDAAAGNWLAGILQRYGADSFFAALSRVRRLAGRERGFWLASVAAVDPKQTPLLRNPPNATDDQVWMLAFGVFLHDEMGKVLQHFENQRMEAAIQGQI